MLFSFKLALIDRDDCRRDNKLRLIYQAPALQIRTIFINVMKENKMILQKTKAILTLSLVCSTVFLVSSAQAAHMGAAPTGTSADYGAAVAVQGADKQITVSPETQWVNVNNGETVQFLVGGKTFAWHFDTYQTSPVLNLSAIAPPDLNVGKVKVFVAPDPLYMN